MRQSGDEETEIERRGDGMRRRTLHIPALNFQL